MRITENSLQLIQEINPKRLPVHVKVRIILLGFILVITIAQMRVYFDTPFNLSILDLGHFILFFVIVYFCTVSPHELMHGIFLKRYTGTVKYGHKWRSGLGPAFYATSPNGFMTKTQFQIVALAPQILTGIYLLVAFTLPVPSIVALGLVYMAAFNLGGGCMDLYVSILLTRYPKSVWVKDQAEGLSIYANNMEVFRADT